MRNTLLILACLGSLVLASCKGKEASFRLDPESKISVKGVKSLDNVKALAADDEGIAGTGLTDSLEYITKYAWECYVLPTLGVDAGLPASRAFGFYEDDYYLFRDLENNKLLFAGWDVIPSGGEDLGDFVVSYEDIVITVGVWPDGKAIMPLGGWPIPKEEYEKVTFDTVAYIPNSVVRAARAKITEAFEAQDYEACYRLFDEAYVFIPTTGERWRAMKEAGIE